MRLLDDVMRAKVDAQLRKNTGTPLAEHEYVRSMATLKGTPEQREEQEHAAFDALMDTWIEELRE